MGFINWICCAVLVANVYFLKQTEGVLNGDLVEDIDQFKYTAALEIKLDDQRIGFCGGAIIDDHMILTAAHCVVNKQTNEIVKKVKIRLRSLKNGDTVSQKIRRAKKIFVPSAYVRGNCDYDIAIIQVRRSMSSRKLQKLELPKKNLITDSHKAVLAGYGIYAFQGNEPLSDGKLRKFDVRIVPNHRCYVRKPNTFICGKPAQNDIAQGICSGDSGSPLVEEIDEKQVVIGVARNGENGFDCDNRNGSGFYTRVSSHLEFINKVLGNAVSDNDDTIVVEQMSSSHSCFR